MNRDGVLYGLGAIALGLVCLRFGDFALQWQPAGEGLPMRQALVWINAAALIGGGLAAMWNRTARWGGLVLMAVWTVWTAMHLVGVSAKPANVGAWLGVAEALALASAGLMLAAVQAGNARLMLAARILFGLCPLVFGLSHFVYADFTAAMVPAWVPGPLFWAWATGAGHVAAGLAILSGIRARLGAGLLALMCGAFVVLLHVPRVVAGPSSQIEWTMTAIALSLTGAAVVMWGSFGRKA